MEIVHGAVKTEFDGLKFAKSNATQDACPACGKKLKFKAPCCTDKNAYLVCPCGYKRVRG